MSICRFQFKARGKQYVLASEHDEEVARLKAEVERLEHQVKYWRIEAETDHARWLRVLEDVERLRKAGDKMAEVLEDIAKQQGLFGFMSIHAWNAAKEGKQP